MMQNRCNVCIQTFNSERELQEHQKNAHSSNKEGSKPPTGERDRGEERKIAS